MRIGGLLSDGIRLGHRDRLRFRLHARLRLSQRAGGRGRSGRLIDRFYLDSIGWRGIRQRKLHLEELLRSTMRAHRSNAACRSASSTSPPATAATCSRRSQASTIEPELDLLRDYSDINVEAGRALIRGKGSTASREFVKGDAFDARSLAAIEPKPTLGIVSGLYELFPDNALVSRIARGACRGNCSPAVI